MSERLLVEEAKRRIEIFRNLPRYLRIILDAVKQIDDKAEVYIFGSVAEGRYVFSSDIDILIVTSKNPAEVIKTLWDRGVGEPFEIHVIDREKLEIYMKRSRLIKLEEYLDKHREQNISL